ncbi:uncharacterized protein [Onthophagus taurus]|uniref:uncharacterized protein isoform X2 n=1 Tax=Onthophagus taurus TaxID=166361 RepID=UPI0039BEB930
MSNMKLVIILFNLKLYPLVLGVHNNACDQFGSHIYKSLGCKPTATYKGCPIYDECVYKRSIHYCRYNNLNIPIGTRLDSFTDIPTCKMDCECLLGKRGNYFDCVDKSCENNLNISLYKNKNCFMKYSLDECCPDPVCTNSPPITCNIENIEYKQGSIINLKSECKTCICTKDFKKLKHCKPTYCDTELFYGREIEKNCAPLYKIEHYTSALCCPSTFICPSSRDVIKENNLYNSGRVCKYGKMKLNLGSYVLRRYNQHNPKNISCRCISPPLMTCVMIGN